MRHRLRISLVAVVAAIIVTGGLWTADPRSASAAKLPWAIASETYYRLDVPNGQASVHMDAEVLNQSNNDITSMYLWAMPVTRDLTVSQDGKALSVTVHSSSELGVEASVVEFKLDRVLKKNARTKLTMDYVAPPQTSENVKFAKGSVEAIFMGQGPGSFVLLDTPVSAETYLDPGCLKAKDQPKDLKNDGLERYVCGEATTIALAAEDQSVLDTCASMDDKCRQRLLDSPYSAFGQSITDASLRGSIEEVMNLGKGPVTVTLRYFRTNEAWAQRQMEVARMALPKLEAFFGSAYPHDRITMLQSHHIELIGAAGVAFNEIGTVLLAQGTGIDDEVTVHELAHQWAHYDTMVPSAMVEGLAEFANQQISPTIGIGQLRDWRWQSFGYTDPISTWWVSSPVTNGYYWYGKSAAFWTEYMKAIGGQANMTAVLAQIGPDPAEPVDFKFMMDRGEEVSGANLDNLFLTWVFADTAAATVTERRGAHTKVAEMTAKAATVGLSGVPKDIKANLDQWAFSAIANQLNQANSTIDAYAAVLVQVDAAGLARNNAVQQAWPTKSLKETNGVIEDMKQAIDAITNADGQLNADALGRPQLEDAKVKFGEGDLEAAERLASGSLTKRYNTETAALLIDVAKQMQADYNPDMFTKIGLWGKDPDRDLALAEEALANGDPESAIDHAKAAYSAWDGAKKNGYARLALSFALLASLSVGTWWLVRKIDGKPKEEGKAKGRTIGGHVLAPADERKGTWKDWENTP